MSWIRSSKSTTLLVLFVLAVAAVGPATGVSVENIDAPDEAQVGDEVTVTVTLTNLYNESSDYTLNGSTQLQNVTGWEVTKIQPNGNTETETFSGQQEFETSIQSSENLESVEVTITGDVPSVEEYSYRPRQTFVAADLNRIVGNNVNDIDQVEVHHYTNESRNARKRIQTAEEAVNSSDSSEAEKNIDQAINAYDEGNFDNAKSLASDAESAADEAEQSEQTMTIIMLGVGAVLAIALVGGGFYYYRNQQDDYDKLR